ncbi:MAG TPA: penicillin-binding protein 2, partial [Armatimonadetes bacterium]|nr:penicillin-binding protein 2 [Armatimonadota bacterium]
MSTISDITLRRCRLFFSLFVFVLIVYALMLVRIQALPPPAATKSALNWRIRREVMPARRGAIYTRDMTPLAISVPHYSICADPYLIRDPDNVAHRLSLLLNMPYEEVRPKLAITKRGRPLRFVWIKRQVTEKIAKAIQAQIKAKTLRGVFIRRECKRVYPSGRLACQVVGFTNVDNVGCEGIEWKWNDVLAGIDGERRQEVNARAEPIPNGYYEERPPVDGKDIILTIDSVIQMHVEKVLRDVMKQADAKGATAVVMDIRTGELLAVANQPDFDLNQYRTSRPECRENKAAHFEYEPGSVFKLIIAAIGLEVGYLTESSRAYCNGNRKIGGMKISCWVSSGHGWQSLSDAIKNSCNVAMAQFAMRIPPDALYKYILKFGFAKRLGSGLPQEAPGWLDPLSTWRSSKIRRANLGYGYGILVTPLQLP